MVCRSLIPSSNPKKWQQEDKTGNEEEKEDANKDGGVITKTEPDFWAAWGRLESSQAHDLF